MRFTLVAAVVSFAAPLVAPGAGAAATVDAGSLQADEAGGRVVLTQPGAPGATLTLEGTTPAGVTTSLERVGEGLIRVRLVAPSTALRTGARFTRPDGERFLGFGERSDAVMRT